jgi:hypothetical protein
MQNKLRIILKLFFSELKRCSGVLSFVICPARLGLACGLPDKIRGGTLSELEKKIKKKITVAIVYNKISVIFV